MTGITTGIFASFVVSDASGCTLYDGDRRVAGLEGEGAAPSRDGRWVTRSKAYELLVWGADGTLLARHGALADRLLGWTGDGMLASCEEGSRGTFAKLRIVDPASGAVVFEQALNYRMRPRFLVDDSGGFIAVDRWMYRWAAGAWGPATAVELPWPIELYPPLLARGSTVLVPCRGTLGVIHVGKRTSRDLPPVAGPLALHPSEEHAATVDGTDIRWFSLRNGEESGRTPLPGAPSCFGILDDGRVVAVLDGAPTLLPAPTLRDPTPLTGAVTAALAKVPETYLDTSAWRTFAASLEDLPSHPDLLDAARRWKPDRRPLLASWELALSRGESPWYVRTAATYVAADPSLLVPLVGKLDWVEVVEPDIKKLDAAQVDALVDAPLPSVRSLRARVGAREFKRILAAPWFSRLEQIGLQDLKAGALKAFLEAPPPGLRGLLLFGTNDLAPLAALFSNFTELRDVFLRDTGFGPEVLLSMNCPFETIQMHGIDAAMLRKIAAAPQFWGLREIDWSGRDKIDVDLVPVLEGAVFARSIRRIGGVYDYTDAAKERIRASSALSGELREFLRPR